MNPYEIGVKLALDGVGLTKTAGSMWWNPVWDSDDPRPWYEIYGQNTGAGLAGLGAGGAGGVAAGAGTSKLLELLKRSPKTQMVGGGLAGLAGLLGAGLPTTSAVFDALE